MASMLDTAPCRDLCILLGEPQRRFRSVHVAGSKGKGTVCALLAASLQRAGWRTGLVTSPHVDHIGERLRLCGVPASDEVLAQALHAAADARDEAASRGSPGGAATWFDTWIAASFWAMARARVDWGVVECGLGGKRDSTNVLDAELVRMPIVRVYGLYRQLPNFDSLLLLESCSGVGHLC